MATPLPGLAMTDWYFGLLLWLIVNRPGAAFVSLSMPP